MPQTVFFSWQTDTEPLEGRNFIERALARAVKALSQNTTVETAIRGLKIDRDTMGVSGQPPIVETIFRKIDQAAVFVPDLTFIGKRPDGRPTPNPNVLIEYGWALKSLGHYRIVSVMNIAFGEPTAESMPFDMAHLRHPLTYNCPPGTDEAGRKAARDRLAKELENHIRSVLESDEFKVSLPQPPEPPQFSRKKPADGLGRFRPANEPIGLLKHGMHAPQKVRLVDGPVSWFRMMPTVDAGRKWSLADLEKNMHAPSIIHPVSGGWHGFNNVHGADGCGLYAMLGDPCSAVALVYAFTTGEIWSIDTYWLRDRDPGPQQVPETEADYRHALTSYGDFLKRLGVLPPYAWEAGMEKLKGRVLYTPAPEGYHKIFSRHDGECLVSEVVQSGSYSPGDLPGPTLKPFFAALYESCGVSRQEWQDK